ncbi:MAG: NepR family anti-sigma factor [Methylocystis sp.]|uniref:NepR family anti-sigma factor n=1 Tax=Methylocystis sp. TaxID=1911079 RepID=UPI003DA339A5
MTMIHDSAPLGAQDLAPQDLGLIGREAGSALHWLYRGVESEPLPDRFAALLAELAAQEARGEANRGNGLSSGDSRALALNR